MPTSAADWAPRLPSDDHHVGRGQQPRHVRDDGDQVEMAVVAAR